MKALQIYNKNSFSTELAEAQQAAQMENKAHDESENVPQLCEGSYHKTFNLI